MKIATIPQRYIIKTSDILIPIFKINPPLSTSRDRINKNGTTRTLKMIKDTFIPFMPYLIDGINTSPAKTQELITISDHDIVFEMAISIMAQVNMPKRSNPAKITAPIF